MFYMKRDEIKNSEDMFLYKAIIDFNSGRFLLQSFNNNEVQIEPEKIYFDFQQSVEKLLKSLLTKHKIVVKKTHDIEKLITECNRNSIKLIDKIEELIDLNEYAVDGRYDIICDDLNDASIYIELIEVFIEFTKQEIGR